MVAAIVVLLDESCAAQGGEGPVSAGFRLLQSRYELIEAGSVGVRTELTERQEGPIHAA